MSHKFKAGDALWFVSTLRGNKSVTVKAVGRKWVTLAGLFEGQRIAVGDPTMTVEIPNYGRAGRCYLSEQQYIDELALEKAWDKFRLNVMGTWAAPDAVTVEWIAGARKFLGMDGDAK